MDETSEVIGFIVMAIIIIVGSFISATILGAHVALIKCENIAEQGFDTKLVDTIAFDKDCFVEINNKYVPYNRWISVSK